MNKLFIGLLLVAFATIVISAGSGMVTTANTITKDLTLTLDAGKAGEITKNYPIEKITDVNYEYKCDAQNYCVAVLNKKGLFSNYRLSFSANNSCTEYTKESCLEYSTPICLEYGVPKCLKEEPFTPEPVCIKWDDEKTCVKESEPVCTASETRYVLGECIGWKEPECIDENCLIMSDRTCNQTAPEVLVTNCLSYAPTTCLEYEENKEPKCLEFNEPKEEMVCTEYEKPICIKQTESVCTKIQPSTCSKMTTYTKDQFFLFAYNKLLEDLSKQKDTTPSIVADQTGKITTK
jgi:hypothetical protein